MAVCVGFLSLAAHLRFTRLVLQVLFVSFFSLQRDKHIGLTVNGPAQVLCRTFTLSYLKSSSLSPCEGESLSQT